MTSDSGLFRTAVELGEIGATRQGSIWVKSSDDVWVPLYEAKMIHHYDHRWATYEADGMTSRDVTATERLTQPSLPRPVIGFPKARLTPV